MKTTALAMIMALGATPVLAASFSDYDINGDGVLSEAEYAASISGTAMVNTDTDAALEPVTNYGEMNLATVGSDGVITRNEMLALFNDAGDDDVMAMDTNSDGVVTVQEMMAHLDPKVDPNVAAVEDNIAGTDETQTGDDPKGD